MDPIVSWMDADEVRQLASQLMTPVPRPEVGTPDDAGFGAMFEGFVVGPSREREQAAVMPESAVQSEVTPESEPVASQAAEAPARPFLHATTHESSDSSVEPEFKGESEPEIADDGGEGEEADLPVEREMEGDEPANLARRMQRFRQWLEERYEARGAFVLDREGNPVIDDPAYVKLHFLARSLAQAYRPVKGEAGNVHVKIGADAFLSVVPVDTAFGCLVLGVVLPVPLDAARVRVVAEALSQVATPVVR
ncbi:hypothetical protein HNR46_002331 [Haloferula luteola]|uniref:Uncharacterized protein n=1 Tax=Haloferula luteola TaxID=595692 RepID=A0A840VDY7_9BACT|nr:hypothetical protein [Haloferula luteola]MBB5352090.1 hypothetical protein [Haloferula luteola]